MARKTYIDKLYAVRNALMILASVSALITVGLTVALIKSPHHAHSHLNTGQLKELLVSLIVTVILVKLTQSAERLYSRTIDHYAAMDVMDDMVTGSHARRSRMARVHMSNRRKRGILGRGEEGNGRIWCLC